jgi:hypothetical protein
MKFVVHAARIPEGLLERDKDTRMLAGDLVYVNVCDDQPWRKPPEGLGLLGGEVCLVCKAHVEANRAVRGRGRV